MFTLHWSPLLSAAAHRLLLLLEAERLPSRLSSEAFSHHATSLVVSKRKSLILGRKEKKLIVVRRMFVSKRPWDELATYPGCHSAFAHWQSGYEKEQENTSRDNPLWHHWLIFWRACPLHVILPTQAAAKRRFNAVCLLHTLQGWMELGWTLNLEYVNRLEHAARRLSHLKSSIRWAAPDILTRRRDYSGER